MEAGLVGGRGLRGAGAVDDRFAGAGSYDTEVREAAAATMVTIHARLGAVCIAASLGQVQDPAGDERLSQLLHRLTGQSFGTDGRAWRQWLKHNIGPGHLLGG